VWDLLRSSNDPDLINRPDLWAEAAVNAEDCPIDDSSQYEKIEDLAARFPD